MFHYRKSSEWMHTYIENKLEWSFDKTISLSIGIGFSIRVSTKLFLRLMSFTQLDLSYEIPFLLVSFFIHSFSLFAPPQREWICMNFTIVANHLFISIRSHSSARIAFKLFFCFVLFHSRWHVPALFGKNHKWKTSTAEYNVLVPAIFI